MTFNSWGKTADEVANTILDNDPAGHTGLVILSGGMDSATCLNIAIASYGKENVEAISFNYGQKHSIELEYAKKLCALGDIPQTIIHLDKLADTFQTALSLNSDIEIPLNPTEGVPPTYVPFRNTIMLSIAAGYAESWGFDRILYGANLIAFSGYRDCRPEYIDMLNGVLDIHTQDSKIKLSHIDLAYLAGFWEGDGHCSYYTTNSNYLGNVGVEQNKANQNILEKFKDAFGGQIVEKDPKYNNLSKKPMIRWEVFGHAGKEALIQLLPFMHSQNKIEKAKAYIDFFSTTEQTLRNNILNKGTYYPKYTIPTKKLQIEAPIIYLSKAEVVKLGKLLGVDYSNTWSCYRGEKWPCGNCPSCIYRLKGFKEAGMVDPLKYGAN